VPGGGWFRLFTTVLIVSDNCWKREPDLPPPGRDEKLEEPVFCGMTWFWTRSHPLGVLPGRGGAGWNGRAGPCSTTVSPSAYDGFALYGGGSSWKRPSGSLGSSLRDGGLGPSGGLSVTVGATAEGAMSDAAS